MAENINEILAENLTFYRKAAGYTQLEIAEKFNYSDKSISKWERGEGTPDVFVLKKLADLYGISVDDFFNKKKKRHFASKKVKQRYIVGLSIGLVWLTAAIGYAACMLIMGDLNIFNWWLLFIYAIVGSGIVGTVFSSIYKNDLFQFISISVMIWSACVSGFLTVEFTVDTQYHYFIFLIGIPLQILAILFWFLRRSIRKKNTKEIEQK